MVSHYPATFDVHRHCGSGDMMFAVVEEQDSTCPRLDPPCHALPYKMSGHRHNNLSCVQEGLRILVTHVHKNN